MLAKKRGTILALITLIMALAGCGGAENRAAKYLAKARELFDQGEYAKAQLEVRNALKIEEKLVEGWVLRAKIQEKVQDWQGAFRSYNTALSFDENNVDALTSRGHILLAAKKIDEAKQDYQKAALVAEADPKVILLEAFIAGIDGDRYKAQTLAKVVLDVDPSNESARVFLARLHLDEGKTEAAVTLLKDGMQKLPDSLQIPHTLLWAYRKADRQDEELELLQTLVDKRPDDVDLAIRRVASLAHYGKVGEAEQMLRGLHERATGEDKERTALVLTDLWFNSKSPEAAEQAIKTLAEDMQGNPAVLMRLGSFYLKQKKYADAQAIYEDLINRHGTESIGVVARKRLAGVRLAQGEVADGKKLLEQVLKDAPHDGEVLTARATLALQEQRIDAAISDLRVVVGDSPEAVTATGLLVKALLAQGKVDLATDQLEHHIEAAPKSESGYLALSDLYARLERNEEAQSVLERMLKEMPKNTSALSRLAKIELRANHLTRALEYAQSIQTHAPERPDGHYLAGLILQARGEHRKAIEAFGRALAIAENAVEPLTATVRSRVALGESDVAKAELEEMLKANPKHIVALNLIGELQNRAGDTQAAVESFEAAKALNPKWAIPYMNLATLNVNQGKLEEAISTLQLAKENTDSDAALSLNLAKLYVRANQPDRAVEEYSRLLESAPDAHQAANNLALLLVEHEPDDAARKEALALAARFEKSRNPIFRDTVGWVYYHNGDLAQALPHLEFAAAGAPENPEIQFHLGMIYKEIGRKSDAKELLERAAVSSVEFPNKDQALRALRDL